MAVYKTARVMAAAALIGSGGAACSAARLAIAEAMSRTGSREAVRRSALIGDSDYDQRWADLDPAQAREALAAAVKANPRASPAWIELGLLAERSGKLAEAERDFNQAALVDRQYQPAWTLANYFFRHGDADHFWPAAARAAALAYDDPRPLLDLCDRMEPDPARAVTRLGRSPRIERSYLDLLIGKNRLEAAAEFARSIPARRSPKDDAHLTDLTERLIAAGNENAAIEIWNRLGKFAPLLPGRGAILTNGGFATAPSGSGFDWRLAAIDGITSRWSSSSLGFLFSGAEPDESTLLEQWMPLEARRYRLTFEYRTEGMPPLTGLRWMILPGWAVLPGDAPGYESRTLAAIHEYEERRWNFTPAHSGLARLRFVYRREAGTLRAEGHAQLRVVRLEME
jgi:tetratricopeptide (TPR) repeat protein